MAKATGVSVAWISRFADDKIPNPGVNQVQAIFDYLGRAHERVRVSRPN
jgi:predicted transcriptional regulator